ncbi:MAG: L-ribulose-5-phosphate 4-epimerase [Bacilli bacterium]|nr:L-ribulose-5-phosphate 4-epimerase [Bacilli bacterium]
MLETLKERVFQANLELVKQGLVIYTWGNVSGIDPASRLVVIKPSGVDYETMKASDMVVVDLAGNVIEGSLRPSSDTPTHLEMYRNYPEIGGVVHTHAVWATSWAQSGRAIPVYGTTHCDYFYGDIPCTRELFETEIKDNYELNTGKVIVETINALGYNAMAIPAINVSHHGPFTWGKDPMDAVHNAKVMDTLAEMAYLTEKINGNAEKVTQHLLDKHYLRKHGAKAYYGQK